ncbi:hypothetical protein AB1Y20_002538 [Prymnesium parvum]|uniref:J domain-containing protein n=1 Tax=Prymnesium parvum TaxID=97485 RepID=A0AB34J9B0_PRYPA
MAEQEAAVFALTCVSALVVPWAILKLKRIRHKAPPPDHAAWRALGFSASSPIVLKAAAAASRWPRWLTLSNSVFTALCLLEAYLLLASASSPADTQHFDPYDVLGIASDATLAEVRQAYRQLALLYHPDKNPDPEARGKFVLATKAHAVLTDAVAAHNYRTYGTPDGYQGYRIGIVAFLLDERLLAPALLLVVGLPLLLWYFTRDPRARDGGRIAKHGQQVYLSAALGIEPPSPALLHQSLRAALAGGVDGLHLSALTFDRLPLLVARCFEPVPFHGGLTAAVREAAAALDLPSSAKGEKAEEEEAEEGEEDALAGVPPRVSARSLIDGEGKAKAARGGGARKARKERRGGGEREEEWHVVRARELLLRRYIAREEVPPPLRAELEALLLLLPGLLDRLLYTALLLRGVRLTDAALPLLQLTQSVSQAAPPAAELLQLPHLTPPTAAALGGAVGGHTLAHLLATPREARAEALRAAGLRAEQRDDVEAFLRLFPRAEVSVAWGVEGEEAEGGRVRARDVVTFRVTLALPHRQELRAVGARLPAHAPRFPHARPEAWVVLLCEPGGGGVLAVAAMPPAVLRGSHTAKLTVQFARAGTHALEVRCVCSAYLGADVQTEVSLEVMDAPKGATANVGLRDWNADGDDDDDDDEDDGGDDEYDDEEDEDEDEDEEDERDYSDDEDE